MFHWQWQLYELHIDGLVVNIQKCSILVKLKNFSLHACKLTNGGKQVMEQQIVLMVSFHIHCDNEQGQDGEDFVTVQKVMDLAVH